MKLTHINENGNPKMVNVGAKNITERLAIASGRIKMSKATFELAISGQGKKGPVEQIAIISAIMGAKKTSELIAMAHPILISGTDAELIALPDLPGFELRVKVSTSGQTGVWKHALFSFFYFRIGCNEATRNFPCALWKDVFRNLKGDYYL